MKCKVYMRVGQAKLASGDIEHRVNASTKPTHEPITQIINGKRVACPTAAFALDLDIPDSLFRQAERVLAEIKVTEDTKFIASDIHYIED